MRRRALIGASAFALTGLPLLAASRTTCAQAADAADAQAFDYAWLKGHARHLAGQPFARAKGVLPPALAKLNWDQWQAIRFRPERALWAAQPLPFRIQFFHLGLNFRRAVRMHEVVGGSARAIACDPALFDLSRVGADLSGLPPLPGFAGFRIHFHTDFEHDVTAFLGSNYFRAVGGTLQYGLSARGLAVDCGLPTPEEFPDFTAFWLERPAPDAAALTVYALLESPSVTGAYRFEIQPGATQVMRVDAALYPRRPVQRLGIAPLTSMFVCGPNDRRVADDWRPAIHDSDGLAMWTGSGEWIWRPLVNPPGVRVNTFADARPHGFGLLQRDRNFDHYQDDGVFYDRRPSVWVEPLSGFDQGAVQLLEIPARYETADNIVAFWNPGTKGAAGEELLYAYRLHWGTQMPAVPNAAQALMTRTGIGGIVSAEHRHFSWRFVVDFAGGELAALDRHANVESVVSASRGMLELISARPLDAIHGWRAMFDLKPEPGSTEPVDLRLFLRLDGRALSETWLYQWTPPATAQKPA
jgi:glucans biosynthesis protein